jgi:hypothetical protein
MKYQVAFSDGRETRVEAKGVDAVLRHIDKDFPRGSVVGIAGPRGGSPRFYMKREDGDTPWPISACRRYLRCDMKPSGHLTTMRKGS